MRQRHVTAAALILAAIPMAACSMLMPPRAGTPSSAETPVVLGTAIIAPDRVVPVVTDAVRSDPQSAVEIATAATAGAPSQATAIRTAVIREAPANAEAVTAATAVKPRRTQPTDRIEVPRHDRLTSLVDAAGFVDASQTAKFQTDVVSRVGGGIARTFAGLGRSVLQFVEDLK